jgi:hypothetical protein
MKKIITTILFLISVKSYSVTTIFSCIISENFGNNSENIKIEFLIEYLGTDKARLVEHPKADKDKGPIFVKPEIVTGRYSHMTNLNAQGGDLKVFDDKIILFGDGDGYTFVDLVLYKNQDYQRGYVKVYGSGDKSYQTLYCNKY